MLENCGPTENADAVVDLILGWWRRTAGVGRAEEGFCYCWHSHWCTYYPWRDWGECARGFGRDQGPSSGDSSWGALFTPLFL